MGFFGALGKVLAGKPIYGPEDVQPQAGSEPSAQPSGKVVPTLRMTRVECPVEGTRMDVYVNIHNESTVEVFVDRMKLLGTVRQIDSQLRPGEARQFHVYSGSVLQNADHNDAEVQYRTTTGDYFAARHNVRFQQEGDHTYRVSEFHLVLPIVDMH
jgi:hypothetical protein